MKSLSQHIKGVNSGSVRKDHKIARLEVSSTDAGAAAVPVKGLEKKFSTKIENVCKKTILLLPPLVQLQEKHYTKAFLVEKDISVMSIWKRKRRCLEGTNTYFEFPQDGKLCSDVSKERSPEGKYHIEGKVNTTLKEQSHSSFKLIYWRL